MEVELTNEEITHILGSLRMMEKSKHIFQPIIDKLDAHLNCSVRNCLNPTRNVVKKGNTYIGFCEDHFNVILEMI